MNYYCSKKYDRKSVVRTIVGHPIGHFQESNKVPNLRWTNLVTRTDAAGSKESLDSNPFSGFGLDSSS